MFGDEQGRTCANFDAKNKNVPVECEKQYNMYNAQNT
jgi:hypothetical protein